MNVLVAAPYLHPEGGGLERYADAMARHLAARGHDVTLVGHAARARVDAPPASDVASATGGVCRVAVPLGARVSNTPVPWRFARGLARLLDARRFDVVVGHAPVPGAAEVAQFLAARRGVPFVLTYHAGVLAGGSVVLDAVARAHAWTWQRRVVARSDARIAVSRFVARRIFGGHAADVIPPGVAPALLEVRPRPVPGRVLFVAPLSRAYRWKGFDVLYAAFRTVAREDRAAQLHVVGAGEELARHAARAVQDGLGARVVFRGRLDDAALAAAFAEAAVTVLPSTSDAESFGMVLAEANACGCPVVASRVGGVPEFVRDGENGFLVTPGDVVALAGALREILADAALARRLGVAGRARVRREHQWPELARRTDAVLTEACARGPW